MPPAARILDWHVCPLVDVLVPHVGGPVAIGCPNVMIGFMPAARVGDFAVCCGPPDPIVQGSATVIIGGMPAARVGDLTSHGGALVVGCPTVIIGDVGYGSPATPAAPAEPVPPPAPAAPVAPVKWPPIFSVKRGPITITVNRLTKTITIDGKQEFFGPIVTQDFVDKATKSINDTWSGTTTFEGETYTVKSQVTRSMRSMVGPVDPDANQVFVKYTTDPPDVHKNKDPANEYPYGRQPGMVHQNEDDGGTLSIPHEFGHVMGLKDEYTEGAPDADGNRSLVRTGPPGGLMGYIDPGSKPTPQNYTDIINGTNLLD